MRDKTHYTLNHILSYIKNLIAIGLICWVAIELETAAVLWALLLIVGGYKHDFFYEDDSKGDKK